MRKSFKFKAKLSPSTTRRAEHQLELLRELYNAAIEERREAWKRCRKSITLYDQIYQIPAIRSARPEFAALDSHMTQETLKDVDAAFKGFFRRVKAGQTPGYPRFRGRNRFDSSRYQRSGWKLTGRRLTLRGIGTLRLFLSRELDGKVKTVTLKRDRCGDWWVCFSCDDVPARPLPDTGQATGVDVGVEHFAALSDGMLIDSPRPYRAAEARLRIAQRKLSKMQRGGSNRRKWRTVLARKHRTVASVRRDFLFKTAVDLCRRFDVIAVEDLNVSGLARGFLAKHVRDAGWSEFVSILAHKAEEAGRRLILVDPRGTSQVCSGCGCLPEIPKTLKDRIHACADCGLVLNRDVNAARNILTKAGAQPAASRPGSKTAA